MKKLKKCNGCGDYTGLCNGKHDLSVALESVGGGGPYKEKHCPTCGDKLQPNEVHFFCKPNPEQ